MNKGGVMFLFLIIFSVLVISFSSATMSIGSPNHSIEKKYGSSQSIIGWINISTKNESANSSFKDSLNNQISLINLLKLNPQIDYTCNPGDCEKDYTTSNAQTTKQLIQSENPQYYGLKFLGELNSIDSINFKISASGIPASCNNQLEVDFFDDGIVDFYNTAVDVNVCSGSKTYGCYDSSAPQDEYTLSSTPYCQNITLPAAPGFRIGAWVKKESGSKNLTISIYNKGGDPIDKATCKLPNTATSSGGEIYCDVNYSVKSPDAHYICISSNQGAGTYKIRGYDTITNGCGFFGDPIQSEISSYDIFAEAKKFGSFQGINITNSLSTQENLAYLAEKYIENRNGNLNCPNGCVVPIKFETNNLCSGDSSEYCSQFDDDEQKCNTKSVCQYDNDAIACLPKDANSCIGSTINLSNLKIDYQVASGIKSTNTFYDLQSVSAKISSSYGKLYLNDSGLKVKNTTGNISYTLSLEGKKIFSEKISVEKTLLIRELTPLKTTYAFPTKFTLKVDFPGNVKRYEWDFGDNYTDITLTNKTSHTYNNSGNYSLKVIIKDINNLSSSKTFEINVTSPSAFINDTLIKMNADLANVKKQINTYDLFYQTSLNEILNTTNMSARIKALEDKAKNANDTTINKIVGEILTLNIPEAVTTTKTTPGSYIFYPERDNIDVDVWKEIDNKKYNESDETYRESILGWNANSIGSNLAFKEVSAQYSERTEPILKVFEFNIQEKSPLNYTSYFIIKDMENLKFKENYNQKNVEGYKYIEITSATKKIIFSTTADVSFDNVPAFLAPPSSRLSLIESEKPEESEFSFNWEAFGIALLALLVIGVIVYIILQRWYRHRYEGHLFKNKNDLYNIFNYIEMQRRKGTHERDIHSKLRNTGWNSEQINYAMKKHSGKRTGMLEIPVEKLFGNTDKKDSGKN